ncbi:uncharacterized protein [Littorina saxatilis]|uniref:uncharacterized protein n=1 Tax=Littorina saxatilis TaxID=31220 RepID=UPI0038B68071
MGLLSLDTTTLTVLRDGGTDKERKYAKRILPLVSRHHLLLVTLLLTNAVAVESMPIFLDRVSDPLIAIVVSVTAILLFGEVIPQAVCTRHGLAIGAVLSPLVYMLMGLLFIISWPLSKLLDCILGEDHGTFYRRGQLKVLVDMHGPGKAHKNGEHDKDEQLTIDEVLIIKGALDMKFKTAGTAMISISDVYMISLEAKLDHETMTHIITRGHSRIPVYAGDRSNVIGLLLTKTLIKLSPADATPVAQVLQSRAYARPAMFVDEDMPLFDLLNLFRTGKSHLAMVQKKTGLLHSGASGDSVYRQDDTKPLLTIEDELYEDNGDYYVTLHGRLSAEFAAVLDSLSMGYL